MDWFIIFVTFTWNFRIKLELHVAIFPQVSADDSAEEAGQIETNGAVSIHSTGIFSPHIFVENGQLVHIKSQWLM